MCIKTWLPYCAVIIITLIRRYDDIRETILSEGAS